MYDDTTLHPHLHAHTCSPLAVAMFDYEAFGEEEDNLEFEEGDLIEVSEKREGSLQQ